LRSSIFCPRASKSISRLVGLGQHLVFFFPDVMPDTLGQHGEFGRAVVIAGLPRIELRDKNAGDMMLFVSLVHNVGADLPAHGGVEDFFFDDGVNLKLVHGPDDDFLLRRRRSAFSNLSNSSLTVS